nr:Uma2 family endonuclease [Romeria gracilis]
MALTLELQSADIDLSDEQFYRLCQVNRDLRLERTAEGKLIIMPPTGWETGNRNFRIAQQLGNWADADGTGIGFDSSTGFRLPNGAIRSLDAAWVQRERLEALNPDPTSFCPSALTLQLSCGLPAIPFQMCRSRCRTIWRTASDWAG